MTPLAHLNIVFPAASVACGMLPAADGFTWTLRGRQTEGVPRHALKLTTVADVTVGGVKVKASEITSPTVKSPSLRQPAMPC